MTSTNTNGFEAFINSQEQPVQTFVPPTILTTQFSESMKTFRARIDALSQLQKCIICNESYTGMSIRKNTAETTSSRCFSEKRGSSILYGK
jgi:hypothetical protein